jgi:hypothetical protein
VTLIGCIFIVIFGALLILERRDNNTLVTSSLAVHDPIVTRAIATLPFKPAGAAGSGILVRMWVAGEPASCAQPLELDVEGSVGGKWALAPSTACGTPGVYQLNFACPTCTYDAQFVLDAAFDFSCQSVLMEVGAVDADGSLNVFKRSAAGSNAGLLTSATWTLALLEAVINSTVYTVAPSRGFVLIRGPRG